MIETLDHLRMPRKFCKDDLKKSFRNIQWSFRGKVLDMVGPIVESHLPGAQLGTIVEIIVPRREDRIIAEVVGFKNSRVLLLPYGHLNGVSPSCDVLAISNLNEIPCGNFLLGKVLDPFMNDLTGLPLDVPDNAHLQPTDHKAPNPLARQRISQPLSMGIRALDGLLTFGEGQRIGIMAGSGVGKSVLMGMIARNSSADINVIALIGERGREVREFIEKDLGQEGLRRSVLVTVTSDQSPLMRIRGAKVATAIAEHFSQQGKSVMLMVDSLTRIATAQREIGTARGETPTTEGYTPSVFSLLPRLLERSGPQPEGCGAISGLYTVLVDGDDFNGPIADAARSILDGHINLSRDLAAKAHFPAIDISTSSSRVMNDIVSREHWLMANRIKELIGVWNESLPLIQTGSYQPGSDPKIDLAIRLMPLIDTFLRQEIEEFSNLESAITGLVRTLNGLPLTDEQADGNGTPSHINAE